jgi:hypothetical protein
MIRVSANLLPLLATLAIASPALAQRSLPRPWAPPGIDSLRAIAAEAKVEFQNARGDSVTGDNYSPYNRVSGMARGLLREMGPDRMQQAYQIQTVMDSLGLEVQVALDPKSANFVFLMVRNPWRPQSPSVGYVYWWKANDLRIQGCLFFGGKDPVMRVWWTGEARGPYELGVIDRNRAGLPELHLTLMRCDPQGNYWDLVQYEGRGPSLGGHGDAAWVDLNFDGIPELTTWIITPNDSLFTECTECPKLVNETTYIRRGTGFEPLESRLVPTPYSAFSTFIHLLIAGQPGAASRLLVDPTRVDRAVQLGWGRVRRNGTWHLQRFERDERWPRWLGMRFNDGTRQRHFMVRFQFKDGRWLIGDWEELTAEGSPLPKPPGARPPNEKRPASPGGK